MKVTMAMACQMYFVCDSLCDQPISLYLPAEIIDDIVNQMSISML